MDDQPLDLVCVGRASADLYGEQVGGPLENMRSFAKYVGGCPTNIAIGTSRLGLRSSLITRVGDEQMGRFIRESLKREGVEVSQVRTDRDRLTALVILGIRDGQRFPHIFYRENCADMALSSEDIDEDHIARAKGLVVTGTHFSTPTVEGASKAAIAAARRHGVKVIFDIDFRPVLWGLAGHGEGDLRDGTNQEISESLRTIVPNCDLIVGTEEEFAVLGGTDDLRAALARVRSLGSALLVLKRGSAGCQIFEGNIPENLDFAPLYEGFPIEVFNTLGAGDGFMSGFLRGWLRGESLEDCARFANACGAIVVSRHGCAPAIPSWAELRHFLENGVKNRRLRDDAELEEIHWKSLRPAVAEPIVALAFDHRKQLEDMASRCGATQSRISYLKSLIAQGARQAMAGQPGRGAILDGKYAENVLSELTGHGWWLARAVEEPGSRPLRFEDGIDVALALREWPSEIVAKCLVHYHPDDSADLRAEQQARLRTLQTACRASGRELLIEVIPPTEFEQDAVALPRALKQLYDAGLAPDWWKLPAPQDVDSWDAIGSVLDLRDPYCRGVLLLGLDAPENELAEAFALARRSPWCRGFAIGRSIFAEPSQAWFEGRLTDQQLSSEVAKRYRRLADLWVSDLRSSSDVA